MNGFENCHITQPEYLKEYQETKAVLHEFKITCKLCGSKVRSDFDYPSIMFCPNILILDESRCRNNYTITTEELITGTYNKEMFNVTEKLI